MTSVETRDLLEKVDRFRVNNNTRRVGKSRHVDGKLVVVGGERNPASLAQSFRVRGREREGKR